MSKTPRVVFAFDVEGSGCVPLWFPPIAIGWCVLDENYTVLEKQKLCAYRPGETVFEPRCWDFWKRFTDVLATLEPAAGDTSTLEELREKMIVGFFKALRGWERIAGTKDCEIIRGTDNPSYDPEQVNSLLSSYTPNILAKCTSYADDLSIELKNVGDDMSNAFVMPLAYSFDRPFYYSPPYGLTDRMKQKFEGDVLPKFRKDYDNDAKQYIARTYELPEFTDDGALHSPEDDAYRIAWWISIIIDINDGHIKKRDVPLSKEEFLKRPTLMRLASFQEPMEEKTETVVVDIVNSQTNKKKKRKREELTTMNGDDQTTMMNGDESTTMNGYESTTMNGDEPTAK